jgi:hypothetical protein
MCARPPVNAAWCPAGPAARCRCRPNWPTPRWQCWPTWACPWHRLATPPSPSTPSCAPPAPMLDAQRRLSQLPATGTLLVEQYRSREGWHLFVYPFAGRHVHLGLASLLGWRLSRHRPNTFSISVNDYGFELLAAEEVDLSTVLDQSVFDPGPDLLADVLASLNSSELARRRFREIARVAGLVFTGYPGAPKSTRQLQASSGPVLRRVPPVRPRQPPAAPGRCGGAGAGAESAPAGRQPGPAARLAGGGGAAARAQPVRAGADGRALPRAAQHREAVRPAGPHRGRRRGGDAVQGQRALHRGHRTHALVVVGHAGKARWMSTPSPASQVLSANM